MTGRLERMGDSGAVRDREGRLRGRIRAIGLGSG